jgi:hypothetical protein
VIGGSFIAVELPLVSLVAREEKRGFKFKTSLLLLSLLLAS